MTTHPILIIGAGMAGIACARALTDAGHTPVILDKGRGIGGRLATRRTSEGWHFDHGAQYVRAKTEPFQTVLDAIATPWPDAAPGAFVGTPGMSGLAKALAHGIDIRQNTEVTGIVRQDGLWHLSTSGDDYVAETLILTAPQPQTLNLIGPDNALSQAIRTAKMVPNLTLMLGFTDPAPDPGFVTLRNPDDPIAWLARNSAKPDRPAMDAWVAQASLAFSQDHLEQEKDAIADLMLPLACDRLGIDPAHVAYASAHRWRYATVTTPVGQPFLKNGTLYLGGDWCLGAKVEHAWTSGTAIAQAILETR